MNARSVLLAVTVAVAVSGGVVAVVIGDAPVNDDGDDARYAVASDTEIVHDGAEFTLESGPGQAVRGRTDLQAGTELTVRVRSTDSDRPYLRSVSTTVDASGGYRAVFDLSEVPPGTPLEVVVHRNGSALATEPAEVVECVDACTTATPTTPSAVIDADGGEVGVENGPGQAISGRTNLRPGTEVIVRVRSTEGPSPFLKQTVTVVDGNGTFRSVFDFDDIPPSAEFRVTVAHDDTTLTSARGVVECADDCRTSTPTGRQYADADVGVVQVANGSVARIRVDLGRADEATLAVGDPGADYTAEVAVRDDTGDGTVVVLLNTSAASTGGRTVGLVDPGDSVQVRAERGSLTATEYRLQLHPVDDESATVATGLLVVTQTGATGTPLLTPTSRSAVPLGSAVALVVGALLAVLGVAILLGLVDI